MNNLFSIIINDIVQNHLLIIKIIISILLILLSWITKRIILSAIMRRTEDVYRRYSARKSINNTISFITIFFLFWLWFAGIRSMATYLGLLSAGIAIALKDFIINLAGWFFIIWRKPFDVGDRIEIGNRKGDIIDIRIFEFSMLEVGSRIDAEQSTGRVLHIPNGQILSKTLANYNREFNYIWNEIPIIITFESNWNKTKALLLNIGKKHSSHLNEKAKKSIKAASKKFLIYFSSLSPTVYTSTKEYGILLTLRYLCEPKKIRLSESEIWEELLREIKKSEDINLAYPTYRITEKDNK